MVFNEIPVRIINRFKLRSFLVHVRSLLVHVTTREPTIAKI